ncbi:YajG family lipoprotein [Marinomonas sp. 15G1-11]|uniref:YajG family lipoprotein n=1 Tax=Marinomonas phaeophyticola TaxID=3004091 RepID=A0ABT4JV28_9GAMM|nr:YajG family lipoprotein [Marinomonas sp. 15G1-11]MCZ2722247.1 YajG family lipoprotein [Marinomonas sp. 15G1-11]
MLKKIIYCTACAVALITTTGCANTTHYINLDPSIELQSAQLSNTHPIKIKVTHYLDNKIGSIDTAIHEHADVFISNEVAESIKLKIAEGLTELGYDLENGTPPANILTVDVTQLSYTTSTQALKTIAKLKFNLKATLKSNNQTYSANYGSEVTDEYGSLPDQEEVEASLNKLAGETVNRLLNDSNIRALLR